MKTTDLPIIQSYTDSLYDDEVYDSGLLVVLMRIASNTDRITVATEHWEYVFDLLYCSVYKSLVLLMKATHENL